MGGPLGSTHFRALFESALQTYEKKTGITLDKHPLAVQLQNCRSVESVVIFLQDQIGTSSDFGGNDRIMIPIKSTISILSTLSATPSLDWATVMVCMNSLIVRSTSLTVFLDIFT